MCIIAVKPAGKPMFSDEIIENMFDYNSDGAGFMYPESGAVRIRKGFMTLKSLKKALLKIPNAQEKTIVLHCRIQTSGGVTPQMTHPFPLSDKDFDLTAQDILAPIGIAHNGILPVHPRKGFSDSADFIKYQLYPLTQMVKNWRRNEMFLNTLEHATDGSRLAILLNDGTVIRTGDGWIEHVDGCFYSNDSFKDKWKRIYGSYIYDDWDDYGYDGVGSYYGIDRMIEGKNDNPDSPSYGMVYIDPDLYCIADDEGNFYSIGGCYMDEFGDVYEEFEDDWTPLDGYYVLSNTTLREVTYAQIKAQADKAAG